MAPIEYDLLIPAYNAGKTLPQLFHELDRLAHKPKNIIVVDDGSSDDTAAVAQKNKVEVISFPNNKGKGYALRSGFKHFLSSDDAEYLLCMDADMQHPPASIDDFLQEMAENDRFLIIGKRKRALFKMPPLRILSNSITSKILSLLLQKKIEDSQCGFRMFHRSLIENLKLEEDGFQLESEFIIRAAKKNINIRFIDIPTIYNNHNSNIRHINDTYRFIRLIVKELFGKNDIH